MIIVSIVVNCLPRFFQCLIVIVGAANDRQQINFFSILSISMTCVWQFQALNHGFLDFRNFNVLEYEHYEVCFVFDVVTDKDVIW